VPAVGGPPRDGRLAFWRADGEVEVEGADASVELALPAGRQVRRRVVAAHLVPVADVLDELVGLPANAHVSDSLRAWAVAARLAVDLVARGRLLPGVSGGAGRGVGGVGGVDAWRLGPLDPADLARRGQLAAALPPAAHAAVIPTPKPPVRVHTPDRLVVAFGDAVADTLPRTAAAVDVAGHAPFATAEAQPMDAPAAAWLSSAAAGATEDSTVALRLEPPEAPDAPFSAVLQIQSARDPSLVVDAADLWTAPETVFSRFGDDVDTTLLLTLRRGSRVWPPIKRLLDDAHPVSLALDDGEADELFGETAEALAGAGIVVLWPADLFRTVGLRAVASPVPGADSEAALSLDSLLELRFEAAVDGERLTEAELALLAESKRPVVRLRGQWLRADPALLERLRRRQSLSGGAALNLALGGTIDVGGEPVAVEVEGPLAGLADRLVTAGLERVEAPPASLDATLRPYQERGLAWLAEMAGLGLGGVLADDMGLGKTVQLLALHLRLQESGHEPGHEDSREPTEDGWGPTLVVCPVTLIANWEREAARFAPSVVVRRYHGRDRSLDDLGPDALVLVTYGVLRRDHEALAAVGWGLVAADEAQAVKNPLSRSARALRSVPARARFALTGTPVENRLVDLWSLLDWTTPGLLGPLDRFRREVAVRVERDRDPDATEDFARLVRPFLLRRRKSDPDIVPDLPPKTETDRFVPLTTEQVTLYRAVVAETMAAIAEAEGMTRRGLVLKLLTALKQICNHPAHYLGQPGPLSGRSGKLDAATDLLTLVRDEGDHALVFTQYVAMGHLLQQHLEHRGLRTLFLHGSLRVPRRQEIVDRFQAGEADAFILSLKAGGTGLNLTRATHVVHYDRWWDPAVEDQASDRAWRIGQDRPVQIHRLLCEGTVEDKVAALLSSKRALADAVVGSGEGWVSELSDEDLAELVALAGQGAGLGSEDPT